MTKTEHSKTAYKPASVVKKPSKTIPAFSVIRVKGGWAFVHLTLDENMEVLSSVVSQPDTKPVITERFKIEVGKYWGRMDEQTI